jgi:hypothetical protein
MDINLHSFNGPHDSDRSARWGDKVLSPGPEISDTLKFSSQLRNFSGFFGVVHGGKEDCVDVNNRCENLRIHAELWVPHGKYLATIKGGSKAITLSGCVEGHGSEVDVDIGNISDQSDNATGPVYLNLKHVAGDPITVRIINGSRPFIANPDNQKYVIKLRVPPFWGSLFAKIVHQLRKVGWV